MSNDVNTERNPTTEVTLHDIVQDHATTLRDVPWILSLRSSETISFTELQQRTDDWHVKFATLGLERGDRVGLLIFDPVVLAATFVSLICLGIWVAPLDPSVLYASGPRTIWSQGLFFVFEEDHDNHDQDNR